MTAEFADDSGLRTGENEEREFDFRPFAIATRAGDGTRTHDLHVGNVSLYQLSYTRKST